MMEWVALSAGQCGSECVEYSKGKNIFLFVMSLLFYAYGEPKYVFLMLFMILFSYCLGLCIEKYHSKWIGWLRHHGILIFIFGLKYPFKK